MRLNKRMHPKRAQKWVAASRSMVRMPVHKLGNWLIGFKLFEICILFAVRDRRVWCGRCVVYTFQPVWFVLGGRWGRCVVYTDRMGHLVVQGAQYTYCGYFSATFCTGKSFQRNDRHNSTMSLYTDSFITLFIANISRLYNTVYTLIYRHFLVVLLCLQLARNLGKRNGFKKTKSSNVRL